MSLMLSPIPSHLENLLTVKPLRRLGKPARNGSSPAKPKAAFATRSFNGTNGANNGNGNGHSLLAATSVQSPVDTQDIITLLGPGTGLSSALLGFASSYGSATDAFTNLFTFPFLNVLQPEDSQEFKNMNTRDLLLQGNNTFHVLATQQVTLCRNLKAFSLLSQTLLQQQTVSSYAEVVLPIVTGYANQLTSNSEIHSDTFDQLVSFINTLKKTISTTTDRLASISDKIQSTEQTLNSLSVGDTLVKLLSSIFNLDSNGGDAVHQIAVILGIAVQYLTGDFQTLRKNKAQLNVVLTNLRTLQTRLEMVNTSFSSLSSSLSNLIQANETMTFVWTDIVDNLLQVQTLPESSEKLTAAQLSKLAPLWKGTVTNADLLINVLTGAVSASQVATQTASIAAAADTGAISFPQSDAELSLFRMAAKAGVESALVDPPTFRALAKVTSSPAVQQRNAEKFVIQSLMAAPPALAKAAAAPTVDDLLTQIGYLGPPADVQNALNALSSNCVAVINTFNNILQQPSLDSLQILNPFKTASTPQEPDQLDIRTIVVRYQSQYQDLQTKTVDAARRLISYATYQQTLLPNVTPYAPMAGQISLTDYLNACMTMVNNFVTEANNLSNDYINFGNQWRMAQNNLQQSINTCIQAASDARDNLIKTQKQYEQNTLWGVLKIFGAVALFALGAFTLPFGLLAIAGGAVLLYSGIKNLVDRGQLQTAIDGFTNALNAANKTKDALTALVDPMQKVADVCAQISGIWSDIAQNLVEIQLFMQTLDPKVSPPTIFTNTVDTVIANWGNVKRDVIRYVDIITTGGTSVKV